MTEVIGDPPPGRGSAEGDAYHVQPLSCPKHRTISGGTLVNIGWFGTGLALLVLELPFKALLKEQLHVEFQRRAAAHRDTIT